MGGVPSVSSFTPRQVMDDTDPIVLAQDEPIRRMLLAAANYVSHTLTSPDPALGRSGAICPFVAGALMEQMITLSVLPARDADVVMLRQAALAVRSQFLSANNPAARSEALRAVIILMPHVETAAAASMIEEVQKALKPDMVEDGLMIGEFFPGCTAPGLNNPAFRPADTAFAFLAIRRMTAGDLAFLVDNDAFVDSYLARFGDEGRRRLARLRPDPAAGAVALQAGIVAQSVLPSRIAGRAIHAA